MYSTISARIEIELKKEMEQFAKEQGISISQLIRWAVEAYMQNNN